MTQKIAYCKNCQTEYSLIEAYGEKCLSCGSDLYIAEKITEKEYSCIKIWDKNNITKEE